MSRLDTLLLDAGNTLVFLDHEVIARQTGLARDDLRRAEAAAKRRYEARLRQGASHDDGWYAFMDALLERAGATGDRRAMVRELRAAHDRHNLWRRVPEGLPQTLHDARRKGWKLGVVSNSEGRLEELLVEVGIASCFDVIVDSGVVGVAKPDPRIFELALEALGSEPRRAIYAGDVPEVDVGGARRAGLQAALIDPLDHYADFRDAPRYPSTVAFLASLLNDAGTR